MHPSGYLPAATRCGAEGHRGLQSMWTFSRGSDWNALQSPAVRDCIELNFLSVTHIRSEISLTLVVNLIYFTQILHFGFEIVSQFCFSFIKFTVSGR